MKKKITIDEMKKMYDRKMDGQSYAAIGEQYGLAAGSIYRYVSIYAIAKNGESLRTRFYRMSLTQEQRDYVIKMAGNMPPKYIAKEIGSDSKFVSAAIQRMGISCKKRRRVQGCQYYYIDECGNIQSAHDRGTYNDINRCNAGNYYVNRALAEKFQMEVRDAYTRGYSSKWDEICVE